MSREQWRTKKWIAYICCSRTIVVYFAVRILRGSPFPLMILYACAVCGAQRREVGGLRVNPQNPEPRGPRDYRISRRGQLRFSWVLVFAGIDRPSQVVRRYISLASVPSRLLYSARSGSFGSGPSNEPAGHCPACGGGLCHNEIRSQRPTWERSQLS